MSSFKDTQLGDLPVAYWTFDYDEEDSGNNLIIDEISNRNPMVAVKPTEGYDYALKNTSLNPIETTDQYSMVVAPIEKRDGVYRNQYFEVKHSSDFAFPDKGEVTIEWLMHKKPVNIIKEYGEPGYYRNITTPIFTKGSKLKVTLNENHNYTDTLVCSIGGMTIQASSSQYPLFNRTLHCIVTRNVDPVLENEFDVTLSLYVNGRKLAYNKTRIVDVPPDISSDDNLFICGNGGSNPVTDYTTEPMKLDQIAIYSYGFTDERVARHYRKTKQYDGMIRDDIPQHYWRFDDIAVAFDNTISSGIGGLNGTILGAVSKHNLGSDNLVSSRSIFFDKSSYGYVRNVDSYGRYVPIMSFTNDYTLEFWFKSGDNDRGVIFDCTSDSIGEWSGIRVFLNSRDRANHAGAIEVKQSINQVVKSLDFDQYGNRYFFNDDVWHHLVVRYTNKKLQLIIDGVLHDSLDCEAVGFDKPGQVYFMTSSCGEFGLSGNMSELAFYRYALQDQQIYNRFAFTTKFTVSGYCMLLGVPVKAEVRIYDTITGELIDKTETDSATGEYRFHLLNNRKVDIVSKIIETQSARNQIHGGVVPTAYSDNHLV